MILDLEKGQEVQIRGVRYTFDSRGPGGVYLLRASRAHGIKHVSARQMIQLVGRDQAIIGDSPLGHDPITLSGQERFFDLSGLPPKFAKMVRFRHRFCVAIYQQREVRNEKTPLSHAGLHEIVKSVHEKWLADRSESDKTPVEERPSTRSVIRWYRDYERCGFDMLGLTPNLSGNTLDKLSSKAREFVDLAIDKDYMSPALLDVKTVHANLGGYVRKYNHTVTERERIKIPSYRTLLRAITRRDGFTVLASRKGVPFARKIFHASTRTPVATYPLERVQIDHTQLDVRVRLEDGSKVRLYLTLAIDICTRAIVGYALDVVPPGYESVMACLHCAILPKDDFLKKHGLDFEYPMFGIPNEVLCDNGKDFRGDDLVDAAGHLHITLTFTPPRQPWFKSQVERTFGIVNNKLLLKLTGRVFKTKADAGDLQDDDNCITEADLQVIFLRWVHLYHVTPHPAIGNVSPLMQWKLLADKMQSNDINANEVGIFLGKTETRKLSQHGIHALNNTYDSDELVLLRRAIGHREVKIKYSPQDVSRIAVLDPRQKMYFTVLASNWQDLVGRSEHTHAVINREARQRGEALKNETAYLDAAEALDNAIAGAVAKGSAKTSQKVARFKAGLGAGKRSGAAAVPAYAPPARDTQLIDDLPRASPEASKEAPDSQGVLIECSTIEE